MKRSNKSSFLVPNGDNSQITRNDFPPDFTFGTGTSAYQHEGAATRGGRGISIWDSFTWNTPDRVADGSNANVTVDMYDRFKEDIDYMKKMGLDAFRFSISWPRVLPGGRRAAGVNKEGIKFYNEVINTLLANGLEPYVTLFHWDLPQCLQHYKKTWHQLRLFRSCCSRIRSHCNLIPCFLVVQDEYGGFLDTQILDDFREYAELCFWEFGDRVKYWVTLNEPWTYTTYGYAQCFFPPSPPQNVPGSLQNIGVTYKASKKLLSLYQDSNAAVNIGLIIYNPSKDTYNPKDAYTVAKNLLLAHAVAVNSYRTKFQQGGKIGITLPCHWFEALDENNDEDQKAAIRAVDFMLGWFLEPIMKGQYPQNMIIYASENIAQISPEEFEMIKGSIDFLGLNYYTTHYATNDPNPQGRDGYVKDQHLKTPTEKNGVPIGPAASGSPDWLFIVPRGIRELLNHVNYKYNDDNQLPPIYITENGVDEVNNPRLTPRKACIDPIRVKYHQDHLANILLAMTQDGVNVKGYFVWSWCDNFEWTTGYLARFGLMYVDYKNDLARYPKDSALWFAKFLVRMPKTPSNKRIAKFVDTELSQKKLRAMEE